MPRFIPVKKGQMQFPQNSVPISDLKKGDMYLDAITGLPMMFYGKMTDANDHGTLGSLIVTDANGKLPPSYWPSTGVAILNQNAAAQANANAWIDGSFKSDKASTFHNVTITSGVRANNTGVGSGTLTGANAGLSTAIGTQAFATGNPNNSVAVGHQAGLNVTTANNVTMIGYQAGKGCTNATYGIFIGPNSCEIGTGGSYNIAIGYQSLQNISTGQNNIAIGYTAGKSLTTNSSTVIVGNLACVNPTSVANSVIIGHNCCNANGGNGSVYIGYNINGTAGATNEVCIGEFANGRGNNTTTIGYAGTVDCLLNGAVFTSSPSANGAGKWNLGKAISGQTALVMDATKYVEVKIDGVIVKLAVVV